MFVEIMTKLLSDSNERLRFLSDRNSYLESFRGLSSEETNALLDLEAVQLARQAQTLIYKRAHEVKKRVPTTVRRMGGNYFNLFMNYCETFWPSGYKRHLSDALMFLKHVESLGGKQLDSLDRERVMFAASQRTLSAKWARHVLTPEGVKHGILMLWKSSGSVHHRFLYF